MGQARRRGTFEERRLKSIELQNGEDAVKIVIDKRRSSPKHTAMMIVIAEMAGLHIYTKR